MVDDFPNVVSGAYQKASAIGTQIARRYFEATARFLTVCGGGDDGATSGEAAADAAATEALETEFDLMQYSPADRRMITEAMEIDGIPHSPVTVDVTTRGT